MSSNERSVNGDNTSKLIVCPRKNSMTSPVHDTTAEAFWVPPEVINKRRVQSLGTPTRNDSEEDSSSGTVTPASLSGLREFTYSFQSTPLISTEGMVCSYPHRHRQRRASMQEAIDFRKIDSKLYDCRTDHSFESVEEHPFGSINFSLDFNEETCMLTLYLIQARNLVSRQFNETSDPYCEVSLLPSRRYQLQSKIHRKTTNPIFDEEFIFEIEPNMLQRTTLQIHIYDYDQFSRHECIGQLKLPFENMDFTHRRTMWKSLSQKEKKNTLDNGDLIFSLGYLTSAERLTVVVMKARNLRHTEDGKITMDPYVKVILNYGVNKKAKKKKTSTKHTVFTPTWNEAITFNLPKHFLQTVSLELIVCHDNKMGNDEVIGRTIISCDSTGDEKIHWDELVCGRSASARWHSLVS